MGWGRTASSIYCTGGWGGAGGGGGGGGSVAGDAKEREEKEQSRGESKRGKHSPDGRRKAANEEAALGPPEVSWWTISRREKSSTPATQSEPVTMFPNKVFKTQCDRLRVCQKKKNL